MRVSGILAPSPRLGRLTSWGKPEHNPDFSVVWTVRSSRPCLHDNGLVCAGLLPRCATPHQVGPVPSPACLEATALSSGPPALITFPCAPTLALLRPLAACLRTVPHADATLGEHLAGGLHLPLHVPPLPSSST